MFKKVLIIGASRGLGRSIALFSQTHLETLTSLHLLSRKLDGLAETKALAQVGESKDGRVAVTVPIVLDSTDMSKPEGQNFAAELIRVEGFDAVIYAAGGGPHGPFAAKDWKDHLWSLHVGLIAPMLLCSEWLKSRKSTQEGRFIIVGSRIAEAQPDPLATSYAAGKHGLFGFVSSIQSELETNKNKVWLFSPGYMDSEMLPPNAHVRHDGRKLLSTDTAAQALLRWLKKDGPWHRVLN
jgi:short-subunit dehydrogenase